MKSRHYFLDNMRMFAILAVIVYHSGLAYLNPALYKSPFSDSYHIVIAALMRLLDVTVLPILFMISGYLIYPSLQRAGSVFPFIRKKMYHLGLPFLYGLLIFAPLNRYMRATFTHEFEGNFFAYWYTYYIKGHMAADHMWFLSTLFIFSIAAGIWLSGKRVVKKTEKITVPLKAFFPLFLACFISYFFMLFFFEDNAWVQWGQNGILMFQPTRTVLYFCFFLFGVICWLKGWSFDDFGQRLSVGKSFLIAAIANTSIEVFSLFYYNDELIFNSFPIKIFIAFFHSCALVLSAVFLFALFFKYLDAQNSVTKKLSQASMAIYVVHLPIIRVFHIFGRNFDIPVLLKYGLVIAFSLLVSYIVGNFILRPLLKPDKLFGRAYAKLGGVEPQAR